MFIIPLLSATRRRSTDTAATRTGSHWNRFFAACLLSAIALSNTALALDSNTPDKEAVPVDIFASPLPSPEEEAMLREQRTAELYGQGEIEPDLSPLDQLRQYLAQLGLDPDDPVNMAVARLEYGLWSDVVMGGERAAVVDERYGVNGWSPDQIASTSGGVYRTVAAAPLANNLIVEVNFMNTGTGNSNIAIVKRNSRGVRVPWSNVNDTFGHFNDQYIIYPRNPNLSVYSVQDILVHNNRIYVLMTERYVHDDGVTRYRPHLTVFNENGSWVGFWVYCQDCSAATQDGVAMDISPSITGGTLVILGRHTLAESGGFWTVRLPLQSNGAPGAATFANFPVINGHNRNWPVDIAFRGSGLLIGGTAYYVLTNRKFSATPESTDVDPCLLAVGGNSQPDTSFGTGGLRCKPFDQPASSSRDVGIAVKTRGSSTNPSVEDVWVLASVPRASRNGFGIWKMTDRSDSLGFGNIGNGRSLHGGCDAANNGEGCPSQGPIFTFPAKHHIPTGLYQISNSLAISGYSDGGNSTVLGGGIRPYFSQQHILSGDLILLGDHPSPYGTARFLNVTARAGNDFLPVGWTRWPGTADSAQTAISTRLLRDPDRIFYNGFLCRTGRPGC